MRKKSKELGISEKKLEEQWSTITKEACERGTNTHNDLEDGVKGASMFQQAINYLDKREDGVMVTIADIPNFGANYKLLNLKDLLNLLIIVILLFMMRLKCTLKEDIRFIVKLVCFL